MTERDPFAWIERLQDEIRTQRNHIEAWYNAPIHESDIDIIAEHEYEQGLVRKRYPKGKWEPGDPIYERGQTNIVRYMVEIVTDEDIDHIGETAYTAWRYCLHCDVSWGADRWNDITQGPNTGPNNCWNCGRWGRKPT